MAIRLHLLVGQETIKIRLDGIDAPESRQAFGTRSKQALAKLIAEKNVIVKKSGEDRYKRTLGTIYLDQTNINKQLVADGWAWHFKKYSKDNELAKLETKAREAKLGLWADPNPLAPWDFRARQKEKIQPKAETTAAEAAKASENKLLVEYVQQCAAQCELREFPEHQEGQALRSHGGRACGKCGG